MTLPEATSLFLAAGFAPEPKLPHFGDELPGVVYLRRAHTYISLIGYDPEYYANLIPRTYAEMRADAPQRTINGPREYGGQFMEAHYEVYLAPKNPRHPKGKDTTAKGAKHSDFQLRGFTPVGVGLVRTGAEIANLLDTWAQSGDTR